VYIRFMLVMSIFRTKINLFIRLMLLYLLYYKCDSDSVLSCSFTFSCPAALSSSSSPACLAAASCFLFFFFLGLYMLLEVSDFTFKYYVARKYTCNQYLLVPCTIYWNCKFPFNISTWSCSFNSRSFFQGAFM